ncbi:hypothetical protein PORY_000962 [Pneumocystis oryctolagi]|uniref:Uncharacterized protein n=1 Tax=Pneumocystis oryctolagi TaxID=42067 RepID=A0ACB7CCP6_9ASCO|nr:hypothetical protein PORY_000962 [Pneumocystis oryctolagi]
MSDDEEDRYLYGKEEDPKTPTLSEGFILFFFCSKTDIFEQVGQLKNDKTLSLKAENGKDMSGSMKGSVTESEEEEEESDSDIEFVIETKPGHRAEPLNRPAPYSGVRVSVPTKNVDKVPPSSQKTESSAPKPPGVDVYHVAEWNGKSLYHLDMDSLEDKPWNKPGADVTDYFNYGFDEFTWMAYCAKQIGIREEFAPQKFMQMMGQMPGADIMSMAPNMQVMMAAGGFPGMQGMSGMHPDMVPMMGMGVSDMSGFMMNMGQMNQMGQMGQMGFQQFPPGLNAMVPDSQSGQPVQGKQVPYMHNPYNIQSYGGYNQMQSQYNTPIQGSKSIPSGPKAHNIDGVKILQNERNSSSGNHKQDSVSGSSKEHYESAEPVSNSSQSRNSGRSGTSYRKQNENCTHSQVLNPEKTKTPRRFNASLRKFRKTANSSNYESTKSFEGRKDDVPDIILDVHVTVLYQTLMGSTEKYAKLLYDIISPYFEEKVSFENINFVEDLDDYFVSPKNPQSRIFVLVIPSYEIDSPVDMFITMLKDTLYDFRVGSMPLRDLKGYAILGLGDQEGWPQQKFCYQAREVDKYLSKLGARRIAPMCCGDVKGNIVNDIQIWANKVLTVIKNKAIPELISDISDESDNDTLEDNENSVVDMEDIGMLMKVKKNDSESFVPKEMVAKDSPTYKALVKQGYTIVGSHSGVKVIVICRWTKSALRGRGSCYKFSFYGIKSHMCMETTPSLACANKCVFCWRGHTNPVGTSWRWKTDKPEDILAGIMAGHYDKIKQMKGIPGIQQERLQEAMRIRHCALSLVGEPITYPYINELIKMLHDRKISTFLVTNAQHPEALENIEKVTQLYLSIDASTKDSLKKIDRPLFKDFWERFLSCLEILSRKELRTVYRLTLVKQFNIQEIKEYAGLVSIAKPCFIEVKGVTYCGSTSSPLTMKNVPFHEEVVNFSKALVNEISEIDNIPKYDIAAEHVHSCCVLIAQKRFYINDKWYTHIDYDRFFELIESNMPFSVMDYISETPSWAYFNSVHGGFNPEDTRWKRKGAKFTDLKENVGL